MVSKQLIFRTVKLNGRNHWLKYDDKLMKGLLSGVLDMQAEGCFSIIRQYILSVKWMFNDLERDSAFYPLVLQRYEALPKLKELTIVKLYDAKYIISFAAWVKGLERAERPYLPCREWYADPCLDKFARHHFLRSDLSEICIENIDNVPVDAILSCPSLVNLSLRFVTLESIDDNPPPSTSTSLRRLQWYHHTLPPPALISHCLNLSKLEVNTEGCDIAGEGLRIFYDDRHSGFVVNSAGSLKRQHQMPLRSWDKLEDLKFVGTSDEFHHFFRTEDAFRKDVVLFPNLTTLQLPDSTNPKRKSEGKIKLPELKTLTIGSESLDPS
ncbi:hypothetical protein CVT24_005901 [Panaeolus cyanescens]|uniref:F-box domain-containing protein n=1 Tax=Panaeolus cyanescens TaxID=181874 RepID=A0A409X970_9AGAR|nr:hypothetical protein CVT24_005901 [Panaeolus cyanescens]